MIIENKKVQLENGIIIDILIYLNDKHANIPKKDLNSIFFFNSAFFNKKQWKNAISILDSMIGTAYPTQYITYDNSGIGESSYQTHKIGISDFITEFKAIIRFLNLKKIHIFSMSMGTWVGLNVYLNAPENVLSYVGYGILSPLVPKFESFRQDWFGRIQETLIHLSKFKTERIHEGIWDIIFNKFYIPIFFLDFNLNELNDMQQRMKKMLQKMVFPFVKGNSIEMYYDYYQYITETMLQERDKILGLISNAESNIPVLIMNGKKDPITPYEMCVDLSQRLKHSQSHIFEDLGHGSIILAKGIEEILTEYKNFLYFHKLLNNLN